MKKLIVLIFALVFILVAGCSSQPEDAFSAVDSTARESLLSFLESAALGGHGEYTIFVEGDVNHDTLGEVTGNVSGAPAGAEIVSYSFLDKTLLEVGRTAVNPDGSWGPLTVLNGPKALVLTDGQDVLGYWLTPQIFAMAPLQSAARYADFLVSPRESGLVTLALIHSGKYQEAANLLASMREVHTEFKGLPDRAAVFGWTSAKTVDIASTAWTGYAAAVLAGVTDNNNLWEEARTYALYLRDLDVPKGTDARVAGWLLFAELTEKYPEFGYLPDKWQPEVGEYDPMVGTWMLAAGQDIAEYVNLSYVPESPTQKWIHYNLLAAVDQLPDELDLDLTAVPGGKAVTVDGKVSLEATSWMIMTVTGKIR